MDNVSDGFTKNTSAEIYDKHKGECFIDKEDLEE